MDGKEKKYNFMLKNFVYTSKPVFIITCVQRRWYFERRYSDTCISFVGWRRELVLRGVWDDFKQKNPPVDVYYHPPKGTGPKLVSRLVSIGHLSCAQFLKSGGFSAMNKFTNFPGIILTLYHSDWRKLHGVH